MINSGFFYNLIYLYLAWWCLVVVFYFVRHGQLKFIKFGFSLKNYYLLLLPLIVGVLIQSLIFRSWQLIIVFLVFAVGGMLAETLIDIWWQKFYGQRLWVYNVETIYHRYTSWLNFVPWGLGGLIYLGLLQAYATAYYPGLAWICLTGILIGLVLQLFLFDLFKPHAHYKFHKISLASFFIATAPILFTIGLMAAIYGNSIYKLALIFAVVPTLAEYSFGKVCHVFISKRLWDYTYLSIDRGHFTPLAIPYFCFGGFVVWIIGAAIEQYFH